MSSAEKRQRVICAMFALFLVPPKSVTVALDVKYGLNDPRRHSADNPAVRAQLALSSGEGTQARRQQDALLDGLDRYDDCHMGGSGRRRWRRPGPISCRLRNWATTEIPAGKARASSLHHAKHNRRRLRPWRRSRRRLGRPKALDGVDPLVDPAHSRLTRSQRPRGAEKIGGWTTCTVGLCTRR